MAIEHEVVRENTNGANSPANIKTTLDKKAEEGWHVVAAWPVREEVWFLLEREKPKPKGKMKVYSGSSRAASAV